HMPGWKFVLNQRNDMFQPDTRAKVVKFSDRRGWGRGGFLTEPERLSVDCCWKLARRHWCPINNNLDVSGRFRNWTRRVKSYLGIGDSHLKSVTAAWQGHG